MGTFTTRRPITATVEVPAGTVRLAAADRTDTVVDVRPHDPACPDDVSAAAHTRVDFADGDYADCVLRSASGALTVGRVRGNLKADSASGRITAATVDGAAAVSTASGDVRVDTIRGDLGVRTASGAVRVGRLDGSVRVQSASGDVAVGAAVRGEIVAQTSSGDVAVGIVDGTAALLDLRTRSGSVRNALTPTDGPADGDDTLVVEARTTSGDIAVRRAVRPAAA